MSFEQLPTELQLMVMSYLKHPPTLYAMARVNTAWNAYAVDQLWADPPQKALTLLAVILPESRRQSLANKVQALSLQKNQFAFEAMNFGSLRSLSFGHHCSDHMNHAPFIQPSLRSLSYWGDHTFTEESINLVHQRCPDLHSLRVYDRLLIDSALFVNLLQTRRHLKLLALGYRFDQRIADDVLACLIGPISEKLEHLTILCPLNHINPSRISQLIRSTRVLRKLDMGHLPSDASELLSTLYDLDTLEELELGHWITSEQLSFQDQQQNNILPFRNIQDLSLSGDAHALSRLLSSRSIITLALDVEDPDESFYTAIGSMTQLTSLDITLPPSGDVDQEGVEKLRMLRELRRFKMSKSETGEILEDMLQLPWMTDSLFEEFFASYPLLEQLYLYWDVSDQLTEAAIGGLAKSCPRLRDTMLMWKHDLEGWHKLEQPLFLEMEFLGLGSTCEFAVSSYVDALQRAEPFAAMIQSLVPVMNEFAIFSSSLSADALSNTLFPGSVLGY
ncbi:hypothetical protein KCU67_g4570, partial [Aureobasidium melanogenum]